MRPLRPLVVLCLAAPLFASGLARADDSALEGVGGSLRPMRGHPSVRMVSEDVRITLPQGRVEARFVFHNDGPPVDVRIGFPEEGKDVTTPQAEHLRRSRGTHLREFRSWVDGKTVRLTRVVVQRATDETNDEYRQWWVKWVHFDSGQTHVIVDRYRGGWLMTSYGIEGFRYILKSGASWKGPIGHARITCRLPPLPFGGRWVARPRGYRRHGNQVVWNLRNFKPRRDIDIQWIDGFLEVRVNGQAVTQHDIDNGLPFWLGGDVPRREGNEVWLPVRRAEKWLDAELSKPGKGVVRLTRGSRWAELRSGSREMKTNTGLHSLPGTVRIAGESMMVPAGPIVRAFGGKATLDRGRLLWIKLPQAPISRNDVHAEGASR